MLQPRKDILFALLCFIPGGPLECIAKGAERPNVVLILADDLGFSDIGCYGSEIETPNLDRLAKNGIRFTEFHNTARCWPTRAAILTGYYAQEVRRDSFPDAKNKGGSRGNRPEWARLLPEMLKKSGYHSYHSGKWHVDGKPCAEGFDHSYYVEDCFRFFSNSEHYQDDQRLPDVPLGTDFYLTTNIAEQAIAQLKEHAAQHSDEPFFSYVAFTAPHFPLHALPEDIAKYKGKYDVGWDAIRAARWKKLQELGILSDTNASLSEVEPQLGPNPGKALELLGPGEVTRRVPWKELNSEQQAFQAKKMEIHAAMIDRMDQEIGRILEQLKTMHALENTLVLFLSDNGASAEILVRGDGHDPEASPGSALTHLCLGPGWATTSNTPFRRHKMWTHEGGIATPLIAHWPKGIHEKNALRYDVGHVIDLAPTILELAQAERFETWNGNPVPTPPGVSLVPALVQKETIEHPPLWWLHNGHKAMREGDWKIVSPRSKGPWELYNLAIDRSETKNLAEKYPEKVAHLKSLWQKQSKEFKKLIQEKPVNGQ